MVALLGSSIIEVALANVWHLEEKRKQTQAFFSF